MEFQDKADLGDDLWKKFEYDNSQEAEQAIQRICRDAMLKGYAVATGICVSTSLPIVHVFNLPDLHRMGLTLAATGAIEPTYYSPDGIKSPN